MSNTDNIPDEVLAAISAALGAYLKDDTLSFQVASMKPVHHSEINLWALAGRQANMVGPRK